MDQVESAHERVVITRNGRPVAVLISPDDLETLEEILDVLSEPGALEDIQRARADLDAGHFLTADEVRARFLRP